LIFQSCCGNQRTTSNSSDFAPIWLLGAQIKIKKEPITAVFQTFSLSIASISLRFLSISIPIDSCILISFVICFVNCKISSYSIAGSVSNFSFNSSARAAIPLILTDRNCHFGIFAVTDRNCHFGIFAVLGQNSVFTDRNCHFGIFAVLGQNSVFSPNYDFLQPEKIQANCTALAS